MLKYNMYKMTYCFSLWWQLEIMTLTILLTYDLSTKHNLHSQHYYIYVQQQISDASMYTQARENQIVTQMSHKQVLLKIFTKF